MIKVTENGVASSPIQGWTQVMEKVDMQIKIIHKNGKPFDLIDVDRGLRCSESWQNLVANLL